MTEVSLAAYRADNSADRLDRTEDHARRLTRLDAPLSAEGDKILKTVDAIRRARASGDSDVRTLGAKDALTRRDVAVLLDRVLKLDQYLGGVDFGAADAHETTADGRTDYAHLVVSEALRNASRAELRGLVIRDGRFHPDRTVTRETFAMILEDLLYRGSGADETRREHFGNASPFPDVAATRVSFNAVMTAVSRGLMAARDDGALRPHGARERQHRGGRAAPGAPRGNVSLRRSNE